MSIYRAIGLVVAACLALASCATPRGSPGALSDIQPGQRPELASDEAGLWMYMDRIEQRLTTSGRVVTDPKLIAYTKGIICRLAPGYCEDIRFYVVQTPHFNASMAPNGFMQIWTGLLLRAQNEAQLAYVLGHEIAHYLRRHSLQQWRSVKNTSSALIFFQIAAAAAGVGYAGDIAQLVALGIVFKFSRDQEREADDIGLELMVRAGYDPNQAAKIWEALMAEREASDAPEQFIFFSTHPATKERVGTLKEKAGAVVDGGKRGEMRQKEYLTAIRPFRASWLRDEVEKRDFKAMEVVLENLMKTGEDLAELYFFQGELHRLRGQEEDTKMAIAEYQKAVGEGNPPPETYRSLGLLYWRAGENKKASRSFERYLQVKPDACDREIIRAYLKELD